MKYKTRNHFPQVIYIDIDCFLDKRSRNLYHKKTILNKFRGLIYKPAVVGQSYVWLENHSEFQVIIYCEIDRYDKLIKELPIPITRKLIPVDSFYIKNLEHRGNVIAIISDKKVTSKLAVDWNAQKFDTKINRHSLVSFLNDLRR